MERQKLYIVIGPSGCIAHDSEFVSALGSLLSLIHWFYSDLRWAWWEEEEDLFEHVNAHGNGQYALCAGSAHSLSLIIRLTNKGLNIYQKLTENEQFILCYKKNKIKIKYY